jgi:hypothetical protein
MVRVAVLALLCTLALAGCVGPLAPASDDPAPCEGATPVGANVDEQYNVTYDAAEGFTLTASPETVSRGENFTVRLRNAANGTRTAGSPNKYAVYRWHDGEWMPVLTGSHTYNATAMPYAPGEEHVWSFAADRPGLTTDRVEPCGPVEAGRYRFVYFGVGDSSALAARFTVTDS